jgi:hypothetical protein
VPVSAYPGPGSRMKVCGSINRDAANSATKARAIYKQVKKLSEIIRDLILARFYGTILVKFEAGKTVHIRKKESIKLD